MIKVIHKCFLPAVVLSFLLLCGCGEQSTESEEIFDTAAEGLQTIRLGDTDAACSLPEELVVQSEGAGYMTFADAEETVSVSLSWDTKNTFSSLDNLLESRSLGSEGRVSLTDEKAVYDFREERGYYLWVLYRFPISVSMIVRLEANSPWYDFEEVGDLFFCTDVPSPTPEPVVDAKADSYLANISEYLLALPEIIEPQNLQEVFDTVDCKELRQAVLRLTAAGVDSYIGSDETGGIYLEETENGYDIGVYAGPYDGTKRGGGRAVWITIQSDDTKLYTGDWEDDYPEGPFEASSLTTNNGNLLIFDGTCSRGVWDGTVDLRYYSGDLGELTGSVNCTAGVVSVEMRPDGDYWNEDTDVRFCFAALYDGKDTYVQLYRDWTDQYFVTRMAYDISLLGDGGEEDGE